MPLYCPELKTSRQAVARNHWARLSSSPSTSALVMSALLSSTLLLSSCSNSVVPPTERFGKLEQKVDPNSQSSTASTMAASELEAVVGTAVSDGCLHAWRRACNGDEKGAIAELEALDKRYPTILTIQFMMGQVYDHFGHTDKAIEHFSRASAGNEFSSMQAFKLAQAYRKGGKHDKAIAVYRKLIKLAPDFPEGKIGLAQSLVLSGGDKKEARKLVSEALKIAPDNAEGIKLSQELK
jgi:tetratricopeptide (TPR) repeat protein